MEMLETLKGLINGLKVENFQQFLSQKSRFYSPSNESLANFDDAEFNEIQNLGEFKFDLINRIGVYTLEVVNHLSEKTSRKLQYEKAKDLLKHYPEYKGGVFLFYDKSGNFRLSFIYEILEGNTRKFNLYKRYTYFVKNRDANHKTFITQLGKGMFENISDIRNAFSVDKLSDEFYNSFEPKFTKICDSLKARYPNDSAEIIEDFALLFVIRIIFLGFIQKKKWLSESESFLQEFWKDYKRENYGSNTFYMDWLTSLFFKALNTPPGNKAFTSTGLPEKYKLILNTAPYLNGGLFDEHSIHDRRGFILLDSEFEDIFEYIYSYNFTIEENTLYDHELELNPEFLGIIFEKLVNKDQGAVYTPRTEVDFMGRLTLVKWLFKNNTEGIELRDLYELFFDELGTKEIKDDYQKEGSFSNRQLRHLLDLLDDIKICDPACGSGAFLVGMLQIIDEIESKIRKRLGEDFHLEPFDLRKRIIFQSLFGVEVKQWAVWIAQLRLWITLFIEAPDTLKDSQSPILPSLDFKIRCGDSLVQKVGSQIFSVRKYDDLGGEIGRDVDKLIAIKRDYYENKIGGEDPRYTVEQYETKFFSYFMEKDLVRINEQLEKLKVLKNGNASQKLLFGNDDLNITYNVDEIKTFIDELETEKNDIKEKLAVINKVRPLVWIIEFADVFANPNKGGFDIVIGNPPYLRQEDIRDPYGKIKNYKDQIIQSIKGDFPKYFSRKDQQISKQSDLYTYFYVRSLALLNQTGFLTFICENTWLDVQYGFWLQNFLLNNSCLDTFIDNSAEKSFKEDVNTVITIMQSCDIKSDEKDNNLIRFVNFYKPFEEVVFTERLLEIASSTTGFITESNNVRILTQSNLYKLGLSKDQSLVGRNEIYVGNLWGNKYLRAPKILNKLIDNPFLIPLGGIAELQRGFTTGVNKFFYLSKEVAQSFGIEPEYLKPVIKSPKETIEYEIHANEIEFYVFECLKNRKDLIGSGAEKYIRYGEGVEIETKDRKIIGFNNLPSFNNNIAWYKLRPQQQNNFVFRRFFGENFNLPVIKEPVYIDQTFYGGIYNGEINKLMQSLNSTITYLLIEILGRKNLGGGALQYAVYEARNLPIFNPELLTSTRRLDRKSLSIFEECGISKDLPIRDQHPRPLSDRKEIDAEIFSKLNLTESEINDVYWTVCEMVLSRINKADTR